MSAPLTVTVTVTGGITMRRSTLVTVVAITAPLASSLVGSAPGTVIAAGQLATSSADTTTWTHDGAGNQTRARAAGTNVQEGAIRGAIEGAAGALGGVLGGPVGRLAGKAVAGAL